MDKHQAAAEAIGFIQNMKASSQKKIIAKNSDGHLDGAMQRWIGIMNAAVAPCPQEDILEWYCDDEHDPIWQLDELIRNELAGKGAEALIPDVIPLASTLGFELSEQAVRQYTLDAMANKQLTIERDIAHFGYDMPYFSAKQAISFANAVFDIYRKKLRGIRGIVRPEVFFVNGKCHHGNTVCFSIHYKGI